ncbi:hypothetical protein M6G63_28230 (plasmid) [Pseudomonas sp. BYT-5]|uniref:hypothetical protein n=1 Tax=Pseudomonas sp. BYT-5 TaxID=2944392 RepID=UPI002022844D|nr:hypothetical protein [Pseudomonas sp. BYT-5]URD45710.1 hypothetical protein M6G63_28230 [Pseudomonas sp. BYT-5]
MTPKDMLGYQYTLHGFSVDLQAGLCFEALRPQLRWSGCCAIARVHSFPWIAPPTQKVEGHNLVPSYDAGKQRSETTMRNCARCQG